MAQPKPTTVNLLSVLDHPDVMGNVMKYLDPESASSTFCVNKELYEDRNRFFFHILRDGIESWLGGCSIQSMVLMNEKNYEVAYHRLYELVKEDREEEEWMMDDSEEENIERQTHLLLDMLERVPRYNDNTSRHLLHECLSAYDEIKIILQALQDMYFGEGDLDSIDSVGIGYALCVFGGNRDDVIDFFIESNVLDIIGNYAQLEIQCLFHKFGYTLPTPREIDNAFQVSEGRHDDAIQSLSDHLCMLPSVGASQNAASAFVSASVGASQNAASAFDSASVGTSHGTSAAVFPNGVSLLLCPNLISSLLLVISQLFYSISVHLSCHTCSRKSSQKAQANNEDGGERKKYISYVPPMCLANFCRVFFSQPTK